MQRKQNKLFRCGRLMETRKVKQNHSFSGARFKKNKQYIRFKYDQAQQIQRYIRY